MNALVQHSSGNFPGRPALFSLPLTILGKDTRAAPPQCWGEGPEEDLTLIRAGTVGVREGGGSATHPAGALRQAGSTHLLGTDVCTLTQQSSQDCWGTGAYTWPSQGTFW